MSYKKTLDYLFSRLPIYQRNGVIAYKKDINNIISATKILKDPHKKFRSIHIAGTNGKGSIAHMLSSIFQEAGYKVGLYTSPHLKDFRERIKINGKMINQKKVIDFVKKYKYDFEKINLSFFEFTVALAFNYFAKEKIDIGIIETGLGGRLDSTNIIHPELSIISNIGIDHTNLLGNTIEKIAKEKAGIIKSNTPIIIGRNQKKIRNILIDVANKKNASLTYSSPHNYQTDLNGNYQIENINTVVTAILELHKLGWKIKNKDIKNGLINTKKNTGILGRWQILKEKPLIICDIAHNKDGINAIFKQLKKQKYNNLHIVFGTVNDKSLDILSFLPKDAKYYFCKPNIPRGLDEVILQNSASKQKLKGKCYNSVKNALKAAKINANKDDLIFIGGSTFIVAEIL